MHADAGPPPSYEEKKQPILAFDLYRHSEGGTTEAVSKIKSEALSVYCHSRVPKHLERESQIAIDKSKSILGRKRC